MAVQATRRMVVLLVTALVVVAMMTVAVMAATPAFAQPGGSENSCGASNPNIGVPAGPPWEAKFDEFYNEGCGFRNNPHGGPPGLEE